MPFLVSSLSEFRRATSIVANFVVVASLILFPTTLLFPRQRFWGSIVVLLYLLLALVLKVTIRRTDVGSLAAVRIIEAVFIAAVLIEGIWRVYFGWQDGSGLSVFDGLDIAIQFFIGVVLWKNISAAKSLALSACDLDSSNGAGRQ